MKAAYFKEHGGSDKIIYGDYADPVAGAGEVVVRVAPSPALSPRECDGLCSQLSDALRVGLGIRVTVEATPPGALPRWDHKARRVKDERTEVPF